jgi:hypothetical protein
MSDTTPTPDPIDGELDNLLNQLGDPTPTNPPSTTPAAVPDPQETPESSPVQETVGEQGAAPAAPATTAPFDISAIAGRYTTLQDEIMGAWRDDRQRIDAMIDDFQQKINGENPKMAFIEGLVQLMGQRSTATANAMKAMDSVAKMVAAAKSLSTPASPTSGKNGDISSDELQALLDSDVDSDAP